MELVDEDTASTMMNLLSGSAGEEKEEHLVAVDTSDTKAVWIHTLSGWEKICDVPVDCQLFKVCICEVPFGFVLLGGETYEGNKASKCWLFSVSSKQWKRLQDMSVARSGVSANLVNNVSVAMGDYSSAADEVDVCERMDLTTEAWTPVAPLPHPMSHALMATTAGHVYIKDRCSFGFIRYDPHTDSYTEITVPDIVPEYMHGASMFSQNEKLYLLGGLHNLALQYNPQTNEWRGLTPASATYNWLFGCCAVTSSAGKILLSGGSLGEGEERDVIEEYDVEADEWKQLDVHLPFKFDEGCCRVLTCNK